MTNIINESEDFEFSHIQGYKWDQGLLVFDVMLESRNNFEVPFQLLKKDRPLETAKYILKEVIEPKRGGKYSIWSRKILKKATRTIRRMSRYHNIDRVMRLRKNKEITLALRRLSKNSRNDAMRSKENSE